MEAVEKHIVQSGKYAELGELFRSKLQASGWYDNVFAFATRELSVIDNPSANSEELREVHRQALKMIPQEIKDEIMKSIEETVDELVEKA